MRNPRERSDGRRIFLLSAAGALMAAGQEGWKPVRLRTGKSEVEIVFGAGQIAMLYGKMGSLRRACGLKSCDCGLE